MHNFWILLYGFVLFILLMSYKMLHKVLQKTIKYLRILTWSRLFMKKPVHKAKKSEKKINQTPKSFTRNVV